MQGLVFLFDEFVTKTQVMLATYLGFVPDDCVEKLLRAQQNKANLSRNVGQPLTYFIRIFYDLRQF